MIAKRHFKTMVIAAVLFTFMGATTYIAADSDKKALGKEKSDKSVEMQNKKDSMKTGKTAKTGQESGKQEDLTSYRPLVDRTVRSSRGEDIAEIENVLVSDDGSQVKAVLSVGGFLGMGTKKVLIGMDELQFDPKTDYVTYRGTDEDLENRAEYEEPEERREFARRPGTDDKEGRIGETRYKSMEMQSETDPMKSGNQAAMKSDNQASMNNDNKSRLKKSSMASNLIGMTVKSRQDENLGTIQDLIINERGRIKYMVISHGGMLGMGKDRIPIPFNEATVDSENNVVLLDKVHKQMLSEAPEFTEDDWKNVGDSRFDQKIRGFYGEDLSDDYDQKDRMKQGDYDNQKINE